MKFLFLVLVVTSFAVSLQGQISNKFSSGMLYSNLSGLNAELSYSQKITQKIGISGRIAYNFIESYGLRGGIFYKLLNHRFFDINFGAEYNYDRHKIQNLNNEIISKNLEFPLTIKYNINNSFGLYGGISSSINLNDAETNRFLDNLRFGIAYKW